MSQKKINLADIKELFGDDYSDVQGIEILNQYPNTHDIEFTDEDFQTIIDNFEKFKATDVPGVKLSHSDQQLILQEVFKLKGVQLGEELPAAGIIENIYQKGKSLYADVKNIPTVIKEALFSGKLYRYISPEIILNYRGEHGKFLKNIALTNNPSLKHIAGVHLSEGLGYGGISIVNEVSRMSDKKVDGVKDVKDPKVPSTDVKFSEETQDSFANKLMDRLKDKFSKDEKETGSLSMAEVEGIVEKALSKQNVELNALKIKLLDKAEEQKNFGEKLRKVEEDARVEKVEAICKSATMDGVPAVVVNSLKPVLLSEKAEGLITMSEVVDEKVVTAEKSITQFIQDLFKNYPDKVDFQERTRTTLLEPGKEEEKKFSDIEARAEKYIEQGLTAHNAWTRAGEEV